MIRQQEIIFLHYPLFLDAVPFGVMSNANWYLNLYLGMGEREGDVQARDKSIGTIPCVAFILLKSQMSMIASN